MTTTVTGIEPSVLQWARERAGYSVDDVARKLKKDPSLISAWEAGEDAPTYAQLEKLAYQLYKRPLAIFFLPAPPREPNIKQEFRTLPDFELEHLSPDTRRKIRLALAFQLSLRELNNGVNPSPVKIFRDINISLAANIPQIAKSIRVYLDMPLQSQVECRDAALALDLWRSRIERAGIFVFKDTFKQEDISGFCLADEEFPLIYLNNSTPKTRQIFTLIHELAHLLLEVNAITKTGESYIEALPVKEQRIERFCNALAAEILVPADDFAAQLKRNASVDEANIAQLAMRYCTSRETILRRFLDRNMVSRDYYEQKAKQWNEERKTGKSGGNANRTQYAYLSEHYMNLVFAKHYQGAITLEQVADYLGVKTKRVSALENIMYSKMAAQ